MYFVKEEQSEIENDLCSYVGNFHKMELKWKESKIKNHTLYKRRENIRLMNKLLQDKFENFESIIKDQTFKIKEYKKRKLNNNIMKNKSWITLNQRNEEMEKEKLLIEECKNDLLQKNYGVELDRNQTLSEELKKFKLNNQCVIQKYDNIYKDFKNSEKMIEEINNITIETENLTTYAQLLESQIIK